jgi:Fic family protein
MSGATLDDVLERMDLLLATIQLAHAETIENARAKLLGDPIVAAIRDESQDWLSAGILTTNVARVTSVATRTVSRRLAELVSRGVLDAAGAGRSAKYKWSGLI